MSDRRGTPPSAEGLVLGPFRGLRYASGLAAELGELLAPPNDVLSATAVDRLHTQNPCNATHLTRPGDYPAAAATLASWIENGTVRRDPLDTLYVYEQVAPGFPRPVAGLIGALELSEAGAGIVLPHEDVRPGTVEDRLALARATDADLEPIMLVYGGSDLVSAAIATALEAGVVAQATTPDGARHRLAAITDTVTLAAIAEELHPLQAVIADGHHRHAMYLARQREKWAGGAGPGPWDYGMTLLLDSAHSGLQIRAIHRILAGLAYPAALSAAARVGNLSPLTGESPAGWIDQLAGFRGPGPSFVLARPGEATLWSGFDDELLAAALPADHCPEWRSLDVSAFTHYALPQGLGITEGDGDDEGDPVAAVSRAGTTGGTAVLLRPVDFDTVLRVSAAGDRMPRKSTLFVPKPASGLVFRLLASDQGFRTTTPSTSTS